MQAKSSYSSSVAAAPGDATARIQRAIDDCFLAGGGEVRIAAGEHHVRCIRLRSNVTLHLESGARLLASRNPADYDGIIVRDKVEPFDESLLDPADRLSVTSTNHWNNAIIRIYRAHDVAIVGEPGSVIDGQNCYDPEGEEKYRGPHGIGVHFSKNILCRGFTIQNTGNWSHRFCLSQDIRVENVSIRGGHDGLDFHACDRVLVEDCDIRTGDDCIAGFDNENLVVRHCRLNSSCSDFRIGGHGILVEDVEAWGPGESVFRGSLSKEDKEAGRIPPPEIGRYNTLSFFTFYGNERVRRQPGDIVFRNCRVKCVDKLMHYNFSGNERWQNGKPLADVTFDNVVAEGLSQPSIAYGTAENQLSVTMHNCSLAFAEEAPEMFRGAFIAKADFEALSVRNVLGPFFRLWSAPPSSLSAEKTEGVAHWFGEGTGAFTAKPI